MPNHCETDLYIRGAKEGIAGREFGTPQHKWSGEYHGSRGE